MSRISALEAVALAAKELCRKNGFDKDGKERDWTEWVELRKSIDALDACPQAESDLSQKSELRAVESFASGGAEPVEGRPEPLKDLHNDSVCLGHWQMRDHIKALEAFCDQLQSLTPAPAWLPISTAPRDGTIIDFWQEGRRLANWWWDKDEKVWMSDFNKEYFPGVGSEPTHWMPLPPSPHTGLEKTK